MDVRVELTFDWPDASWLEEVDALVIYSDGWQRHPATAHLAELEAFMNRGGGLSVLHWATGIGGEDLWTQQRAVNEEPIRVRWRSLVGADFEPWHSVSVFWDAGFEQLADHPVTQGVPPFTVWDECYFHLRCSAGTCDHVTPLHQAQPAASLIRPGARADSGSEAALAAVADRGESQYCSWGFERPQGGRAFGYTGGHLHWNWARDEVRKLVLNGIYWTSGAEVPAEGVESPTPDAKQMLANLKGNPGWTESNVQAALDRVAAGERVRWNIYSQGPLPNLSSEGPSVLEGESLDVLKVSGGQVTPQGMFGFGAGLWSGDSQLWWIDGKPGYELELALPVAATGEYQLGVAVTKAVDYGRVTVALDGKDLDFPAIDGYQPSGVGHSGELLLGRHTLTKGQHRLTFRISGAHPEAVKRYMVGVDYVRLLPLPEASVALFDGRSLEGWAGNSEWWEVVSGAIVGTIPDGEQLNHNEFLFWDGMLHDFELRMQYRISGDPTANSGVQIRSKKVGEGGAAGYQADIDDGAVWVGRIYDEHGRALISERGTKSWVSRTGERRAISFRDAAEYNEVVHKEGWNDYVIRAVGPRIQTWINGHPASDLTDDHLGEQDFSGRLAVQLHSGPGPARIEFKNVELTHLGKTPLPAGSTQQARVRTGVSPAGANLGFETGTYAGWTVTGDVWAEAPIKGDTVTPRRPGQASRHDGNYWVGGYEKTHTDAGRGVLQSNPFKVTHPWGSFLVGGGRGNPTRVEVVSAASKTVIFSATGEEVEDMRVVFVDLRAQLGEAIFLRVVDESSGHWGHVNYDDFRFHAERPLDRPSRIANNMLLQHLTPNPVAAGAHPTISGMWVPEGFQVDLIATEPTVTQPIAFTFDERGRIWIAEAHSYPQRQPDGQGKDRIIILEDGNGDGVFETKKTFAEGLNLVSGLEVGFGGVWVGAAPELLFIPDRNRDDRPDGVPEVLLDGWGYQDTHETLNSFTWGPDGWLYGNQGVFNYSQIGKPGTPSAGRITMRAGVWRYHPQRHEFEIFATGCSNQWGIDFNEVGHLFITHCRSAWGGGPTSYMIQGGHYWNQANAYHAPFVAAGSVAWSPDGTPTFRNFLNASARYGHGEGGAGVAGSRAIYGGHSHVGTMIYLGRNWPEEYRDQLFTHNLHGHQMNRQSNVAWGSGYQTVHAGSDQLFTSDPQFIGVDLKYGPDGAVYMIDWVDHQHCHTNNAESWDRSNGRLYRMQWTDTYAPVKIDLSAKSTRELVALVTDRDEWLSRTARRVLQERADKSAIALTDRRLGASTDTTGLLRLLWARHVVSGEAPPEWAFRAESAAIRGWAVTLSNERGPSGADRLLEMARSDSASSLRLALASALPRLGTADRWRLAETLAAREEDRDDPYLPKMVWFGLAPVVHENPQRALNLAKTTPMKVLADSIVWYLSRDAAGRDLLVQRLRESDADVERILNLMSQALLDSNQLPAPKGWMDLAVKLRRPATEAPLDKLGGLFGDKAVLATMRARVADESATVEARLAAVQFLRESGDTASAAELLVGMKQAELMPAIVPLMARFNDAAVAKALLSLLPGLEGADRRNALIALSSQPRLAEGLIQAVTDGRVERQWITSFHVRQMRNLKSEPVNRLLTAAWGRAGDTSASARETIAHYSKVYREAPVWAHDVADGAALFTLLCQSCHARNGEGTNLGPDLTGSWRNGVDYFIENIVDPNAVVGESYQLNLVTRKDGTVVSGMLERESPEAVTIRTLTESVTIPQSDVETREVSEQSMMPAGLLEALSDKQAIDLLKFLSSQ